MKRLYLFLITIFFIFNNTLAQEDSINIKFDYSNKNILFIPQKSNLFENRTGLIKDFNSSKLRLDIGFSPDIFSLIVNKNLFTIGADFHAFGLLFNENENIILQVAAIDAIFGGHISFKQKINNLNFSARFRVLHLSSHLVDGLYDNTNNKWKNNKLPSPFGREYFDIFSCLQYHDYKFFFGTDYIFRQRPNTLSKINPELGLEFPFYNNFANKVSCYLSCNAKLQGINDKRILNKTIEVGSSFGISNPLEIFILYYSGTNFYGEFHQDILKFFGIGFNFRLI